MSEWVKRDAVERGQRERALQKLMDAHGEEFVKLLEAEEMSTTDRAVTFYGTEPGYTATLVHDSDLKPPRFIEFPLTEQSGMSEHGPVTLAWQKTLLRW